jgi:hypothetical protein
VRSRRSAAFLLATFILLIPCGARAGSATGFLVLPFENVSDEPQLEWLSTALALHTGEHLRACGGAVVDDEDRAVFLEGNGVPAGTSLGLASALEIGRKMHTRTSGLRPDRLVLGRFNVQNGDITLSGRVIDLQDEKARPWIERQGRLSALLDVHAGLAEGLGRDAGLRGCKGTERDPAPPLLAFETYARGMAESDPRKRLTLLRRALQESPGYPEAAYQTGVLLARAERWEDALTTLQSATAVPAPYEAEYHLLTAEAALQRKDAAAAAEHAQKAVQIAPSARAHALLGRARLAQGDRAAAAAELDRAAAIDANAPDVDDLKKALHPGTTPASGGQP